MSFGLKHLAILAPLFAGSIADFAITSGQCCVGGLDNTGSCFPDDGVSTPSQGICGGYSVDSNGSGTFPGYGAFFTSANPCNTAETFNYYPGDGNTYTVYVSGGSGEVIGNCNPVSDTGVCNAGLASCLMLTQLQCSSSYCG